MLVFFGGPADGAHADEPLPACAPVFREAPAPASVFDPEEPPDAPLPDRHEPDGRDRLGPSDSWTPLDQTWTPFDGDDDDELQA